MSESFVCLLCFQLLRLMTTVETRITVIFKDTAAASESIVLCLNVGKAHL